MIPLQFKLAKMVALPLPIAFDVVLTASVVKVEVTQSFLIFGKDMEVMKFRV
jgi:hypothetical protein